MLTRLAKYVGVFAFLFGAAFLLGCGGGLNSKANFRAFNAVPDQSSINVLLDGTSINSSVSYGVDSGYTETKAGSRDMQVEVASSTTSFLTQTLNLPGATNTTVVIANVSTSASTLVLSDDNTAPTVGSIKLRLVNAAPGLGPVDVYLVPPGTSISTTTPAASNLDFESGSSYLNLSAGSYDIVFTPHGSTFAFFDAGTNTFTAGQNRTVIVIKSLSGNFSIATLKDLN